MTLSITRKVAELVPEAGSLIKRASLENHMPTGSREETLVSALELEYMMKIAHMHVDLEDTERVCKAVDLYDLADEVRAHTGSMVKAASDQLSAQHEVKNQIVEAEQFINTQLLSMNPGLDKVAEASESLWDEYSDLVESDAVKLYAGAGTLVKEAAVLALNHRAKRTGNVEFTKVAAVIESTNVSTLTIEDNRSIISAIRGLEKAASYTESDIYTDMFHTKSASCMVNLGTRVVNADNLVDIASYAGDVLGDDIKALLESAHSNVAAIEALPMGERQVLSGLL